MKRSYYPKMMFCVFALTAIVLLAMNSAQAQVSRRGFVPVPRVRTNGVTGSSGADIANSRSRYPKKTLSVKGGKAWKVAGQLAGHPLGKLPGVKTISFNQWRQMKTVPKTGLHLVETPFVPRTLERQLKSNGFSLHRDGTLRDKKGAPITVFVHAELFAVASDSKGIGYLPLELRDVYASALLDGEAIAASPYRFAYISYSMWWKYRGGFCRDYRAWTTADALGPDSGGFKPHTRIEYMETRAEIGSHRDRDWSYNTDSESSYARWDIGCFWPAHGGANGFHLARWKDGTIDITRTWSW